MVNSEKIRIFVPVMKYVTSNLLKRRQNRHISADFTIETCSNGLFLLSLQQFWTIMQTKKDGDNNDWEGKGEAIS